MDDFSQRSPDSVKNKGHQKIVKIGTYSSLKSKNDSFRTFQNSQILLQSKIKKSEGVGKHYPFIALIIVAGTPIIRANPNTDFENAKLSFTSLISSAVLIVFFPTWYVICSYWLSDISTIWSVADQTALSAIALIGIPITIATMTTIMLLIVITVIGTFFLKKSIKHKFGVKVNEKK